MSGLRLYAINPRSLGTLPEWTVAVLEAERLNCNAIHLYPFHPVSQIRTLHHGRAVTGSLYGITDYFAINPEFCGDAGPAAAWEQLRDFIRLARAKDMRVVADLVFNYLAADHPLVSQRPEFFRRNADGSLRVVGTDYHQWHDVALIDYQNPAAWDYFLGTDGHWLRVIDHYLALGFNAVRCDAVFAAPQLMWEQVLNYTLSRAPDTLVIAETVGITETDALAMQESLREKDARIIYDLCYDNLARGWNGRAILDLLNMHARRPAKISHYGTMGMVDDIAYAPLAADVRAALPADDLADAVVAATCLRDYAVACFTNNSVMLPRGFQWCVENNTGSFREMVSAEFFKALKHERHKSAHPLTLGTAIAEMHRLRARIPAHVIVRMSSAFDTGYKYLTAMQCDFMTHGDERLVSSVVLLLNSAPEYGPQPFPQDFWQNLKENQTNVERFQFGADRTHRDNISGVAILVVPGGLDTAMALNQGRKQAPSMDQPEPSLVA